MKNFVVAGSLFLLASCSQNGNPNDPKIDPQIDARGGSISDQEIDSLVADTERNKDSTFVPLIGSLVRLKSKKKMSDDVFFAGLNKKVEVHCSLDGCVLKIKEAIR